jgi:hypothetical protein
MAWTPSLDRSYPAWFDPIGIWAAAVICIHPTPKGSFAFLASSACPAYSHCYDWSSSQFKNPLGLTGCSGDIMCSANGPSTPGLRPSLAITRRSMLPSSIYTLWAGSERNAISGLNTIQGGTPLPTFHPHYLSVYASTRQLPDALQHSILGLWLRATQAGFTPACHQTISSTLIDRALNIVAPMVSPVATC